MTSKDNRLNRIAASLTAKERALLVLRAWQEDRDVDPQVRWSMPQEQAEEYNHYVRLMTGVNTHLSPWLIVVMEEIEKLGLGHAMLCAFLLWQSQAFELGEYIMSQTKQPVSESEYAALKEQAREKMLTVDVAAYVLTEHYDGWAPEDLTGEQDEHYVAIVTPESWERVKAEKAKEIARLAASGALKGSGKGRALRVQAGSFYDWLGEDAPVLPDWALAYDVLPDDDPHLGYRKFAREEARKAYRAGPTRLVIHLPEVADAMEAFGPGPDEGRINEVVVVLKDSFREGIVTHTRHLRAVERIVAEAWREFGEDPLLPELRDIVDKGTEQLADLHQQAEKFCGPFELEEPTEEEVAFVHRLATKESRAEDNKGRITVSLSDLV